MVSRTVLTGYQHGIDQLKTLPSRAIYYTCITCVTPSQLSVTFGWLFSRHAPVAFPLYIPRRTFRQRLT